VRRSWATAPNHHPSFVRINHNKYCRARGGPQPPCLSPPLMALDPAAACATITTIKVIMDEDPTLHCYELLSMQYLEQSQDDPLWARLHQWSTSQNKSQDAVQVIVNLPKELWFIAILLRENPKRLAAFMLSRRSLISEEEDLLVNYLQSFKLTELYLDTIFRFNPGGAATTGQLNNEAELTVTTAQQHQHMTFRPPLAIFRYSSNYISRSF
jgi:hypothetical protein